MLSDEVTVAVLVHLRERASSVTEIQQAIPGMGYRMALLRLGKLLSLGLVDHRQPKGRRARGAPHHLLTPGRAIQTVIDVAAECETRLPRRPNTFGVSGGGVLSVVADRRSRAIARALAHERMRAGDLERHLQHISHGTLHRRLRQGETVGLIASEREGRETWHSLTDSYRRLASVALYAARWEWIFGEHDKGLIASDLAGLIHQIAPLVRLPPHIRGICLLQERWHTTLESDVYLAAAGGRLSAFVIAPLAGRNALAHGTPQQWAQALVTGDPLSVTGTGDDALLAAVIAGLHRELCAEKFQPDSWEIAGSTCGQFG
jgi:DNA-binding HxlR family transcriptional regulator